jgi:hypothetical protein
MGARPHLSWQQIAHQRHQRRLRADRLQLPAEGDAPAELAQSGGSGQQIGLEGAQLAQAAGSHRLIRHFKIMFQHQHAVLGELDIGFDHVRPLRDGKLKGGGGVIGRFSRSAAVRNEKERHSFCSLHGFDATALSISPFFQLLFTEQ